MCILKYFAPGLKHNGRDGYQVFIHNGAYIVKFYKKHPGLKHNGRDGYHYQSISNSALY